jgi:glyoxylase-like metal-dependent hydrolase (beta-lactamase superfamily II)
MIPVTHDRAVTSAALIAVLGLIVPGAQAQRAAPGAGPASASRVPHWDARGLGPLPRQAIACLDVSDEASEVAVGTIAPWGDPNVVRLGGDGRVLASHAVGQRWINHVAFARGAGDVLALCTMPEGRPGDFGSVFRCGQDIQSATGRLGPEDAVSNTFLYGDHSNHYGAVLRSNRSGGVAVLGPRVFWFGDDRAAAPISREFARPRDAVTVSFAASPDGRVVVGCTGRRAVDPGADGPAPNLFLLAADAARSIWVRPALTTTEVADAPTPEKGVYGTPTSPDGRREQLPQRDVPVSAPLSIALDAGSSLRRIAVADYPGWQRWIRSSATMSDENYGTRFVPSRPTVTVYDERGEIVRRFGPERFTRPGWFDLKFFAGGRQLLAFPHNWTARGLAGQSLLPADDDARLLQVLDVETGSIHTLEFPDAISDADVSDGGSIAVGCWDHRAYRLDAEQVAKGDRPAGSDVGGPSLVRVVGNGSAVIVAANSGSVSRLDRAGDTTWRTDLNQAIAPVAKPWVAKAAAEPLGPGVWKLPGGRVESDQGGQWLIEAPDGLILIEAHAGLSFEREWAAIASAGLDPRSVKYVLATHEHGDHAPGAYLWRVVTGAQFVCSAEMAYGLRHHAPMVSGYGFHPPNPTDLVVNEDTALDLAGLRVWAVRAPGHTYGSMAWLFEKGGRRYLATGDLIMPDGVLGYAGSINFSGRDVLSSLRKLQALKPDVVLPGHGPYGDPDRYIAAGIDVGTHVGWGKIPPEQPDPYFRLTQKNVRVVAWNLGATSADFGDIDGDGRPDVAIIVPEGDDAVIKVFLNHGGTFRDRPDHAVRVPGISAPVKLRVRRLNDDRVADFLVGGRSSALVLSQGAQPDYRVESIPLVDANQARSLDELGAGRMAILLAPRNGEFKVAERRPAGPFALTKFVPEVRAKSYADLRLIDVNGDGRNDLIASSGQVYLRRPDDTFPAQPSLQLPPPEADDWTFLAVGDFNGDSHPDVILLAYGARQARAAVFYHTGKPAAPFRLQPQATLSLEGTAAPRDRRTLLRDTPPVADWDGDGVDDLIVGKGQEYQVHILRGGRDGLDLSRSLTIPLDFRLHFETGLHVDDFDGDSRVDLAAFADTKTGVGAGGPLSVYIWTQTPRSQGTDGK